jgi:nucleoside-diphosphate-sugar epimerase
MIAVGVTAVGGGVGQAVLRALSYSRLATSVVGLDVRPMSAGLYWTRSACLVPPASDPELYVARLLETCARERIDVLIPGSDPELYPLACARPQFLEHGCEVIVSSPAAVGLCRDKKALADFFQKLGLPFVLTLSLREAQEQVARLCWPLIAKPRSGSGSVGVQLLHEPDELLRLSPGNDLVVQSYLAAPTSTPALDPRPVRDGRLDQSGEISAQFFVGESGKVLGSFVSVNRLKDGVPLEVVPWADPDARREALSLVGALAAHGLRGPVNVQGRLTAEGFRFFEVNPRFTGITAVRAAMGYREVDAALWAFVMGQEQAARRCLSYVPGSVAIRHVEETIVPDARFEAVARQPGAVPRKHGSLPPRVLVTGASGYVGANLIARLLATPEVLEVRAAVRNCQSAQRLGVLFGDCPSFRTVQGELPLSPWAVEGVDAVIHLAALRPPRAEPARADQFFLVNVEGTRRLLEAMRRAGVRRLIYLSSQAVYGTGRLPPWSEALPATPETPYGLSKWMAELLCLNDAIGVAETVVLRAGRVYGLGHFVRWHELPHRFASRTARAATLPIYGGGRDLLDLLHVRDLCDAIVRACSMVLVDSASVVLNAGGGQPVSVRQVAKLCQSITADLDLPVPAIEEIGSPATDGRFCGMDVRRASAQLGWTPATDLRSGLFELIVAARDTGQ